MEQKDAYGNGAQAEQETISKRNRIFHAVRCNGGCSALRGRLQCTASGMAKLMPKSILLFRTSK